MCLGTFDAQGEIIKANEPKYAEAVLAYNSKNYQTALKLLNELLISSPGLIEFLELKALILKSSKDDVESAKTYQELITSKQSSGAPATELAPYYFELGVIHFRQKNFSSADNELNFAVSQNFNTGAAHFFLGMLTFQSARYAESETHFKAVLKSQIDDLKPVSHFYLGQVYMKSGYPSGATSSFADAKNRSKEIIDDKNASESGKEMAKEIYAACEKVLGPMNQSRWFSTVAVSFGEDSNVQSLPDAASGSQATGKSTSKLNLQGGVGFMGSPTQTYQFVPNYRVMTNLNSNGDSREGEFLTQTLSLYINRKPLERTNLGFKTELTHTFQNQFDTGSKTEGTYHPYSLGLNAGPYIRTELFNRWSGYLEFSGGPQDYPGDDKLTNTQKRTGSVYSARTNFNNTSSTKWVNPSFGFGYTLTRADGIDNQSRSWNFSVTDGLNITDKFKGSLTFNYSPTSYASRSGGSRRDINSSVTSSLSYTLSQKWMIISDGSYTINSSDIPDSYKYNRLTYSLGVSFTIL